MPFLSMLLSAVDWRTQAALPCPCDYSLFFGIWGHCLPLCCPTGSTVHCSLPAFTGFPVSGYHVLCLFSLLFFLYPPYRIFLTSTKPYKGEDGTISAVWRRFHVDYCGLIPYGTLSPSMKELASSYCNAKLYVHRKLDRSTSNNKTNQF